MIILVFDLVRDKTEDELIQDKANLILQIDSLKQQLDDVMHHQKDDSPSKSFIDALQHVQDSFELDKGMQEEQNNNVESLKQKIELLENQLQGYKDGRKSDSFEMFNSNSAEHMKGVLLKYLKNTQLSDAKNEALLEVVFSMLHLSEGDKKDIKQAREKISPLINENPKSN